MVVFVYTWDLKCEEKKWRETRKLMPAGLLLQGLPNLLKQRPTGYLNSHLYVSALPQPTNRHSHATF